MMATVPHVTSGSGLIKFQADGFLLDRVYKRNNIKAITHFCTSTSETPQITEKYNENKFICL